ncbi:hypothetical protein HAX54_038628 [Datura stramonium]|uniref:Uncharacterized protein n=1 Tax=Datura stramonium TaxID=4076 RepID=A0ABS8SIJ5_DATST|nr:hypothetical protein [Datura stramonium]
MKGRGCPAGISAQLQKRKATQDSVIAQMGHVIARRASRHGTPSRRLGVIALSCESHVENNALLYLDRTKRIPESLNSFLPWGLDFEPNFYIEIWVLIDSYAYVEYDFDRLGVLQGDSEGQSDCVKVSARFLGFSR